MLLPTLTQPSEQERRIHAWLQVPLDIYETQAEAMTHARSIASRTKHRMKVVPADSGWRIRLGEGPLE